MAFCRYWSCLIGIVPFFYSFYFAFCPISFTYLEGAISSFWKMFVNCSYSYWPPHFSFSEVCCTETKCFKGGLKAFPAEYQAKPENIGANKPSQKNIWYNKPRQAKPDQTKGNFYGVKVDKYKIFNWSPTRSEQEIEVPVPEYSKHVKSGFSEVWRRRNIIAVWSFPNLCLFLASYRAFSFRSHPFHF